MHFALIHEDDKVFVSFTKEDSIRLLESYFKKFKSIKKSLDALEVDLKKKTRYK
jgi:hypothetical protein